MNPDPGWHMAPDGAPYERWWDGHVWTEHTRPVQKTATTGSTARVTGWAVLALGAALIVGSFLPWATALNGLVSKNGTDGDGKITIGLGVLVVLFGLAIGTGSAQRIAGAATVVIAAIALLIAGYDLHNISTNTYGSGDTQASVSAGAGLWLVAVSAGLAVVLGFVTIFSAQQR